jgi:Ca2+-binding RTX toxin-like protein
MSNDTIVGGGGDDFIDGGNGDDVIFTDYGRNSQGHLGHNTVVGGLGQDIIVVSGHDTVAIDVGDSNPTSWQHDIIVNFGQAPARIELPGPDVTSRNYDEANISRQGFDAALSEANAMLKIKDYVFISDGHDGYLFADTDGNGRADIGLTLTGLTSTYDFKPEYII